MERMGFKSGGLGDGEGVLPLDWDGFRPGIADGDAGAESAQPGCEAVDGRLIHISRACVRVAISPFPVRAGSFRRREGAHAGIVGSSH